MNFNPSLFRSHQLLIRDQRRRVLFTTSSSKSALTLKAIYFKEHPAISITAATMAIIDYHHPRKQSQQPHKYVTLVFHTYLLSNYQIPKALVNHLKHHFPAMHRLYTILHERKESPTEEEIEIANGTKVLDVKSAMNYLKKLELASENIVQAFNGRQSKLRYVYWCSFMARLELIA